MLDRRQNGDRLACKTLTLIFAVQLIAAAPSAIAAKSTPPSPSVPAATVPSPAAVTPYRGPLGLKWGQLAPDARCRLEKRFTFISEVGPSINNHNTIDQHYRGNFAGMPVDDMLLKFHRGEFFYLAVSLSTSQASTLTKIYADAVGKMVESYGPPIKENRPPRLVSANGIPDHTPVLDQGASVLPLLWNEQTGADAEKLAQLHDIHIRSGLWQPFAGWQFANNVTIQIFVVMEKAPQPGVPEVIKPIWIIAKEDRLRKWQQDAGNRGLYHFPVEEWPPRDF